jgi:hypothetical protein
MAWRFRRSLKFGPLKLNLSKSGVGYSVGVRGIRVGQDARGRSYTAASIPGTGLYNRTYSSQGRAAGGDSISGSGATSQLGVGNGLGIVVAFFAGAALVLFLVALFSSQPSSPPVTPPAAVTVPVTPPPAIPAKRRHVRGSKPASAPGVRSKSARQTKPTPQAVPSSVPAPQ